MFDFLLAFGFGLFGLILVWFDLGWFGAVFVFSFWWLFARFGVAVGTVVWRRFDFLLCFVFVCFRDFFFVCVVCEQCVKIHTVILTLGEKGEAKKTGGKLCIPFLLRILKIR